MILFAERRFDFLGFILRVIVHFAFINQEDSCFVSEAIT